MKLIFEGGKSFAHANRKALYYAGKHIGTLFINRGIGWYGGHNSYIFHATIEGNALGFQNHYDRYQKKILAAIQADIGRVEL